MNELAHVLRHVPIESDDAVLVGLDSPDDSAVYRLSDDQAIVQSVDFFTPIVDDPFDWGRIAAANALSDLYAMGARPSFALNLVGWPRSLSMDLLGRVLEGAGRACREAGAPIVGGHSIDDDEPKFGLAVTGTVHPDRIVHKRGAAPGADLVLTKPLGTGIISSAIKEQRANTAVVERAVASMAALNKGACEAMVEVEPQAATDVTGFGFIGHLIQMLDDGVEAEIDVAAVPLLEGAVELADQGVLPGGSRRNFDSLEALVDNGGLGGGLRDVLFDAQTSGGLLIATDSSKTRLLMDRLTERGVSDAAVVGRLVEARDDRRVILR
jgi:selenide, water dikinase